MKTYEKSRKLDIVQENITILLNETWRFETPFSFAFENVRQGFYTYFIL